MKRLRQNMFQILVCALVIGSGLFYGSIGYAQVDGNDPSNDGRGGDLVGGAYRAKSYYDRTTSLDDSFLRTPGAGTNNTGKRKYPEGTKWPCGANGSETCFEDADGKINTLPGGSGSSSGGKQGGRMNACSAIHFAAVNECGGGLGIGQGLVKKRQMDAAGKPATNILEACENRKHQAEVAYNGGKTLLKVCGVQVGLCEILCKPIGKFDKDEPTKSAYISDCRQSAFEGARRLTQEMAQFTADKQEAQQCIDAYKINNCETGSKKADNPACIEAFCAKHGQEPAHTAICHKCNRVGGNDLKECPQYCANHREDKKTCNISPTIPGGNGTTIPSISGGPPPKGIDLPKLPDDSTPPDFNEDTEDGEYSGQPNTGSSAKFDSNDNAGGGGGVAGGGAYPGGAPSGGQGRDPGQYNKDIEHGYSSGSGGGYSVGGGGADSGGGGGSGNDGAPIDLSKFLPGGELDPNAREPASDALAAQGITGANDVSNFEKVTRMMTKKRSALKPGEGG